MEYGEIVATERLKQCHKLRMKDMADVNINSSRDSRFIISIALIGVAALMVLIQTAIINMYIDEILSGDWTIFSSLFNVPHGKARSYMLRSMCI